MVAVSVKKNSRQHGPTSSTPLGFFPRLMPHILGGIVVVHTVYRLLYFCYDNPKIAEWLSIPTASSDFCQSSNDSPSSNNKCGRPDLFAFQCVSGMAFWICGSLAFYAFHIARHTGARQPSLLSSPDRRIYAGLPMTEAIVAINLAYQLWDFFISFTIPEHCTLVMMTHHVVAAVVCWSVLSSQLLGYYSIFFLGMSEVSSMFLVCLDMSKYFAPTSGTLAHVLVEKIAAPMFVVTFVYYRVILWWPATFGLARDIQHVVSTGQAEQLRPGRTWLLYLMLGLNIPMGILQLYWLTIIVQEVQATLVPVEMA